MPWASMYKIHRVDSAAAEGLEPLGTKQKFGLPTRRISVFCLRRKHVERARTGQKGGLRAFDIARLTTCAL